MRRLSVVALVAALALPACGSEVHTTPVQFVHADAARLGDGDNCDGLDSAGLAGLAHDDTTWVRVTGFSLTGPAANPPEDQTAPASATLVEQLPGAITLDRGPIYFTIHHAVGTRLTSIAGTDELWLELRVTPAAALGADASNALVVGSDGFAFAGLCEHDVTIAAAENLRRHGVYTWEGVVAVLRSFMSHETSGVEQLLR